MSSCVFGILPYAPLSVTVTGLELLVDEVLVSRLYFRHLYRFRSDSIFSRIKVPTGSNRQGQVLTYKSVDFLHYS